MNFQLIQSIAYNEPVFFRQPLTTHLVLRFSEFHGAIWRPIGRWNARLSLPTAKETGTDPFQSPFILWNSCNGNLTGRNERNGSRFSNLFLNNDRMTRAMIAEPRSRLTRAILEETDVSSLTEFPSGFAFSTNDLALRSSLRTTCRQPKEYLHGTTSMLPRWFSTET